MKRLATAAALLLLAALPARAQEPDRLRPWQPIGPGGGGGNFSAAVSPFDSTLYFSACDMGGFYRSDDAGENWRMIDGISHTSMPVVFDPTDPAICYVAHRVGAFMNNGWALSRTDDAGVTWVTVYDIIGAYDTNSPSSLAIDHDDPSLMWLGLRGNLPGRILHSDTAGHAWQSRDTGLPADADVRDIFILLDGEPGKRSLVALTTAGPFRSADNGLTWTAATSGLPKLPVVGWTSAATEDSIVIYVATQIESADGALNGGLYRSADGAVTWTKVTSPVDQVFKESSGERSGRITAIAGNDAQPDTIYCACHVTGDPYRSGTWKSTDAGATWTWSLPGPSWDSIAGDARGEGSAFEPGWLEKTFGWGWGGPPNNHNQLYVCKTDPDVVLRQDDGRTIGTRDGGQTWQQLYTRHVEADRWTSRGYEVTTCYKVYWNPKDLDKMFIAYTDIGFFRSDDRGESWTWSLRGSRHTNTVYDLAIDPDRPETMWAAVSSHHDMPEWKTLVPGRYHTRGGVSMTTDGGRTWTPMGEETGLPNSSVGKIILDPKSPADNRTLYVTSWGHGVYKSSDGGKNWAQMNGGIDTDRDYNFWRMAMAADGALYLVTTKIINMKDDVYSFDSGALYRSQDGARTWSRLARADWMAYPYDVQCDPVNAAVVYVATKEDPHVESPVMTPGGLFRSADRGATFDRILPQRGPQRITIDGADTNVIYVSTEDSGIYRTADGGKVWNRLQGPAFQNCIGISIDPRDRETIYVTTYGGGVWKGSAYGSGFEPQRASAYED